MQCMMEKRTRTEGACGGYPSNTEVLKDSGLYLEMLEDCWHYQEVAWFDLYLINLPLSLFLSCADLPLSKNVSHSTVFHHPPCHTVWKPKLLSVTLYWKVHNQQALEHWLSEKKSLKRACSDFPHLSNEAMDAFVKTEYRECLLTMKKKAEQNSLCASCQAVASPGLF